MTHASPQFAPGQIVATQGAIAALKEASQTPHELLARHLRGDWGDLDAEDAALNDEALKDGSRLLSAYVLKTGEKLWVITEAESDDGQRSHSTILRPDEY
jgi:hypothetical protein